MRGLGRLGVVGRRKELVEREVRGGRVKHWSLKILMSIISKLFKRRYQISEYRHSNWFRQLIMSPRNLEYYFGF